MYGRRVRRNDKAQEILDAFIAMLDAKMPRRAGIVRRNKQMFLDFIRSELAKPAETSAYIDLDPGDTLDPSVPTLVKRKPYEALQRRKEESIRKHAEKDLQKRLARKRGVLPDWTPSVDSDGSTVVWTAPSGLARVKDSGGGYDERFSAEGLYPDGWSLVGKGPRIGEMFKAAKAENRAALREKRLAEKSQPKVTPQKGMSFDV